MQAAHQIHNGLKINQLKGVLGPALSTCVEMLPRPISMRPHNKTASKHRIRKRRSWVDVLTARPAMTMLKGLSVRASADGDDLWVPTSGGTVDI
jgi:hypothetical protein